MIPSALSRAGSLRPALVACLLVVAAACDNIPAPTAPAPSAEPLLAARGGSIVRSIVGLEPLTSALNIGQAFQVSNAGHVVGTSIVPGVVTTLADRAVIWYSSVFPQDLGLLPNGTVSSAKSITPDGSQIVGYADDAFGATRAVRWISPTGSWVIDPLPLLATASDCVALDIAADGTIAGSCSIDGRGHATVWRNGVATDLGEGVTTAVNANGQVSGYTCAGSDCTAVIWDLRAQPVSAQPIGDLGGNYSVTTDINDNGEVAGWSRVPAGVMHAFVWTARKGIVDLGTLGGLQSFANAINNSGQVVGNSVLPDGSSHAALWSRGKVFDLGVLTPYDASAANGINDNGQVVGASGLTEVPNNLRATLWTVK